jgi:hypothetical protein
MTATRLSYLLSYIGWKQLGVKFEQLLPEAYPMRRTRWKQGVEIPSPEMLMRICLTAGILLEVDGHFLWDWLSDADSPTPEWLSDVGFIRRVRGYSRRALARSLGCSDAEIVRLENGSEDRLKNQVLKLLGHF